MATNIALSKVKPWSGECLEDLEKKKHFLSFCSSDKNMAIFRAKKSIKTLNCKFVTISYNDTHTDHLYVWSILHNFELSDRMWTAFK